MRRLWVRFFTLSGSDDSDSGGRTARWATGHPLLRPFTLRRSDFDGPCSTGPGEVVPIDLGSDTLHWAYVQLRAWF